MTITGTINDGNRKTQVTIEIDGNCISIEFPGTSACINILAEDRQITAFIYSTNAIDPEIITLCNR